MRYFAVRVKFVCSSKRRTSPEKVVFTWLMGLGSSGTSVSTIGFGNESFLVRLGVFENAPDRPLRYPKSIGQGVYRLRFGAMLLGAYFFKLPEHGIPLELREGDQVLIDQKGNELAVGLFNAMPGTESIKVGVQVLLKPV